MKDEHRLTKSSHLTNANDCLLMVELEVLATEVDRQVAMTQGNGLGLHQEKVVDHSHHEMEKQLVLYIPSELKTIMREVESKYPE